MIDQFLANLFNDHRKYLVSTCNLIANSISDKHWAMVKKKMSRHLKLNTNPASLVESIISPCGFLPATFPIIFGSHLQLPLQYIIDPIEEHSTVAEFIYLNPIWISPTPGNMPNVSHRIMLQSSDSPEICGLIYLKKEARANFKTYSEKYWEESLANIKINNFTNVYYGDNK